MNLPHNLADWPKIFRELWAERAALMEFEANYNRSTAEYKAEIDIRKVAREEE